MRRHTKWYPAAVLVLLVGCATHYYYSPGVYPIAEGKIQPFPVGGPVEIVNAQSISDRENVIARLPRGSKAPWMMGDLQQITQALINQLSGEIEKRGGRVESPSPKQMRVAVTKVAVNQGLWTLNVELALTLQLADRPARSITIENRSPGNVWRALNGAIAVSVIRLLGDEDVLQFLAAPPDAPQL